MKKTVFYIPAIILTIFYAWFALEGIGALHPFVAVWLLLLWLSGIFLSKNMFWGGILGILPAIHWIYMSTQGTGQAINIERPLGIIVLLYFAICIFRVYKKNTVKSN